MVQWKQYSPRQEDKWQTIYEVWVEETHKDSVAPLSKENVNYDHSCGQGDGEGTGIWKERFLQSQSFCERNKKDFHGGTQPSQAVLS